MHYECCGLSYGACLFSLLSFLLRKAVPSIDRCFQRQKTDYRCYGDNVLTNRSKQFYVNQWHFALYRGAGIAHPQWF